MSGWGELPRPQDKCSDPDCGCKTPAAAGPATADTTPDFSPENMARLREAAIQEYLAEADEPADTTLRDTLRYVVDRLRYISCPTMGLPAGRDPREYAQETSERHARYALQLCIDNARAALERIGDPNSTADALLPLLRTHEAQVRRDALNEAADHLINVVPRAHWLEKWLRDRAASPQPARDQAHDETRQR